MAERVEVGERLARLETEMRGVNTALDRGSAGFKELRQALDAHAAESRKSIDELKGMVSQTHADCVHHDDLDKCETRVTALETFRDRVKRYGGIGGFIGAAAVGAMTLFGPARVAEAFRKLWE